MQQTRTIALCGKGGVGKTSLCSLMVTELARGRRGRILAIDADPASGLAQSLGVRPIKSVDDIRKDLVAKLKGGEALTPKETLHALDYELFDALAEGDGFALLSIGRPEDEGCFCRVNSLLKDIIEDLAGNFDYVLIDGEAGVEQINRRVMKRVEHLILVSDTSAKGIGVANTIAKVANDSRAVDFRSLGLVLNRVRSADEAGEIGRRTALKLYGWLGEDELIRDYDFRGSPLTGMPDTSASVSMVRDILGKMNLLA
ncbi:MAG TPA: AAA family ATPase [Deltaproteobacteria bacterium]|nr:AAA family ATPase [Deltaproteobacteria bacterium]HOI06080.1 AAA family ATPase [Deltaproteobacteria bacterium]